MDPLIIFEICAVLSLVCFMILVLFLILALRSTKQALGRILEVLNKANNKIEPLSMKTLSILQQVNFIVETVGQQVNAVKQFTASFNSTGRSLRWRIKPLDEEDKPLWQKKMIQLIDLASLGAAAWQQFNKRR